jgi:holin-like protein
MLLLCAALLIPQFEQTLAGPLGEAADTLLAHLSLLFVPVGVGVMVHLGLLSAYGVKLIIVLVLSTWIGLAVTAFVLRSRWPVQPSEKFSTLASPSEVGDKP